jgi:thiol-disulfide isomerase/thioredoxin
MMLGPLSADILSGLDHKKGQIFLLSEVGTVNLFEKWHLGLLYHEFLQRYGSASDQAKWQQQYARIGLTSEQRAILSSFRRRMPVLCLAGAWCGDCVVQCPIFQRFAEAAPTLEIRYLDRDDHADVQERLRINGGNRVPVVVFFSEDGHEVARYGERTLSQYREMGRSVEGAVCPTGIPHGTEELLAMMTQEWLNEFERVHWILRLSPRLRKLHGD